MACNRPFLMKNKHGDLVPVPCGWCLQCRIDKRNEWTMRLSFECEKNRGCFITLTYDDFNLPKDESLNKRDPILFIKRFRKSIEPMKIKYYLVGEYGEIGNVITGLQRPHYHIVITGISALKAQSKISKCWQKGFIKVAPVTSGRIRYLLKYLDKQIHGPDAKKEYGNKLPPFATMSQGIGIEYLKQNSEIIEHFQGVPFNGKIRPIPKYYREKLGYQDNNYKMSETNKRVVINKMKNENIDYITALNRLGSVNETNLEHEINLHNKG